MRCQPGAWQQYLERRAKLPALSWRARCLVVLPVALAVAYIGTTSPGNAMSFDVLFAIVYPLALLYSFVDLRSKPRAKATLPSAHVVHAPRR